MATTDDFTLTTAYLGAGTHVVTVTGELDIATAPSLREELAQLHEERPDVIVLDLLAVSFIDSTALGVLVEASKRLRAFGGGLRIVSDDRQLRKVFEITGLNRVFEIYPTLREALESLGGQAPIAAAH